MTDPSMTPAPSSPVALLDQLDELRAKGTADGPWRLVDHDDRHGPENRYEILDDEGSVAVCSDDNDSTETTGAQRAALIVAAVNAVGPLTAAVRAVLELADEAEARNERSSSRFFDGSKPRPYVQVDAIRATLTAALSVTP